MTKDRGVERRVESEKSYSSMVDKILFGKTIPEQLPKLKEAAYGTAWGRGVRFQPEEYWHVGNIGAVVVDVSDELEDVRDRVDDLSSGIEALKTELLSCKECINRVSEELSERPIVKETWLLDIDEDIEVLQPIPIVIEESDGEVIASFPEVEAFAVGSGEAEAINNIKLEIKNLFLDLESSAKEELGKLPQSWKRILEKVVKKVGRT